ncbi:MAG: GNAT family N-acetyltransferase [Clostridiales bacterium]|nr:GNAT family N-acetyltransferase [Clostridiales bacterium]
MTEYKIATKEDIEILMASRLEMLKVVNDLPEDYVFSDELVEGSRQYFLNGDQTTVLAFVDGGFAGCASISYYTIMPTFSHPTGKRAHVMNVYTRERYRRQGIACKMMNMLTEDAWAKGATEISLDATESGRPLYAKLGFTDSGECMVMVRN